MFTIVSLRQSLKALLTVSAVSMLGVSGLAVNACSSTDAAPTDDPAPTLNGRYAITASSDSVSYKTMWFSSKLGVSVHG